MAKNNKADMSCARVKKYTASDVSIAFLLSPYGLHYLAVKLTARFIGMRILLRERIYG